MRQRGGDAVVVIRLKPRASIDRIEGESNGALDVRVAAPPVDGRANRALLELIAKRLRRPPSGLELVRGRRSREKQVLIVGSDAAEVRRVLVNGDE